MPTHRCRRRSATWPPTRAKVGVTATDYALPPNVGQRYGLRDMRVGIDIPYPAALDPPVGGARWDRRATSAGFRPALPGGHRLADLFAVRYVLVPRGRHARPGCARC